MALEARCAGVKARLRAPRTCRSTARTLPSVQSDHPGQAAAGHVDRLHRHPGCADRAGRAPGQDAAGSKAKVVTFDLNADAAQAIKDGKIEFSVDQQPYVQGYQAVDSLWLNLTNGNDIGGGSRC